MLSKLIGRKKTHFIFVFAFCCLAFALPLNKIMLSLATLLLSLLSVLEWNTKEYLNKLRQNKSFIILLVFITYHLLSLFWTENFNYFWKDFNIKLSFYSIPLIFIFCKELSKKEIHFVLYAFLFSIWITSLINFSHYFLYTGKDDFRQMSIFLSHIRYGLMMVFGLIISIYLLFQGNKKYAFLFVISIVWFLIYIFYSEVFSSYLSLFILIFIFLAYLIFRKFGKKVLLFYSLATLLLFLVVISYFVFEMKKSEEQIPYPKKNEKTILGNDYEYFKQNKMFVNKTPVYTYICKIELENEWRKVSDVNLYDKNKNSYVHYYILLQYMSSKGFLKKDYETFHKLSKKDILNIENGVSNCCADESYGFLNRLQTLKNEWYDEDPNGKTIKQRIEFAKIGFQIFYDHLFFGVSSGDLDDAFQEYYIKNKTLLKEENRLRTHNQFLTYFVSFGLIGGVLFVILCFSFFFKLYLFKNVYKMTIFIILILSFLSEDTLETQMGATLFGFFIGLIFLPNSFIKKTSS